MRAIVSIAAFPLLSFGLATAALAGGGGSEGDSFGFVVQTVSRLVIKLVDMF